MKQVLILFGLSLFLFCSPKDEVSISGIVVDSKTGQPISGALVYIRYEYQDHGSLLSGSEQIKTDTDGKFGFSAEDILSAGVEHVEKSGYVTNYGTGTLIEDGEEKYIEIKLNPYGGVLKLNVTNVSGIHDSIFVQIINPCESVLTYYNGYHSLKEYPLILTQGTTYTQTWKACAEEYSYIKWDFHMQTSSFPPRDSILILANDTTYYNIEY